MSTTVLGEIPELGGEDEPFRARLVEIWGRLTDDGYADGEALLEDLDALDAILRAHRGDRIADGALADVRPPRFALRMSGCGARSELPRGRSSVTGLVPSTV